MSTTDMREAGIERAVRAILEQQMHAWNNGDARLYAHTFAEACTCTNIFGDNYPSREAIEARLTDLFTSVFKGSTLHLHVRRLQCLRPDVAVVDVDADVTGHRAPALGATSPDGVLRTAMLQVLAEEGGAWHVVAFHNTIVQAHT